MKEKSGKSKYKKVTPRLDIRKDEYGSQIIFINTISSEGVTNETALTPNDITIAVEPNVPDASSEATTASDSEAVGVVGTEVHEETTKT
jgi:hypothetical protein